MANARRPAYARSLAAILADGNDPLDVLVFIDRTPPNKAVRPVLAVFHDADPASLDWSLIAGLDVLVPDADKPRRARLRATVQAIIAAAPRRLVLLMQRPPFAEHLVISGADDD